MRKKKQYFVQLFKEETPLAPMELQYHYDRSKGWVITYDGLELGSAWGRPVKYRDAIAEAVSQNIIVYWKQNLVEKFCNIHHIPKRSKEFTHNTDDEIWFAGGASAWSKGVDSGDIAVGKIKVPEWIHPKDCSSTSGCKLHTYMALKHFISSPAQRKRLKIHRVSSKFDV
jgi:hypothetical protein